MRAFLCNYQRKFTILKAVPFRPRLIWCEQGGCVIKHGVIKWAPVYKPYFWAQ